MTSVTSPHKIQEKFLLVGGTALRPVYTGVRYTPPVYTGRMYGPYIRVQKMRPYIQPVYTGRTYGPYIRVVCTRLYTPVYQSWNFGEDRSIRFWATGSWKSTIKKFCL